MYFLGPALEAKLYEEFVLAPKSELQNKSLKPKDLWNRPHALDSFSYCTTHFTLISKKYQSHQYLRTNVTPLQNTARNASISSFRTSVSSKNVI